ncbi:hypothetical protein Y032_0240g3355 [Ancylostoma ceylanicum]|uniref:Uncharacterized protein n=1 Tax=Ancylostoma ceylanicum TaxID=53326 RepID=A0A016SDV1_9BILA|nr:hypothetical protein Y032_0240g3355 [Ancylostoma ceylanicum]
MTNPSILEEREAENLPGNVHVSRHLSHPLNVLVLGVDVKCSEIATKSCYNAFYCNLYQLSVSNAYREHASPPQRERGNYSRFEDLALCVCVLPCGYSDARTDEGDGKPPCTANRTEKKVKSSHVQEELEYDVWLKFFNNGSVVRRVFTYLRNSGYQYLTISKEAKAQYTARKINQTQLKTSDLENTSANLHRGKSERLHLFVSEALCVVATCILKIEFWGVLLGVEKPHQS